MAAVRLGASHVSVALKADNNETSLERVASILREVMAEVEQHELTLMLLPQEGLTDDPERLMALVKLVGGFRIGIQPSIKHAMTHEGWKRPCVGWRLTPRAWWPTMSS